MELLKVGLMKLPFLYILQMLLFVGCCFVPFVEIVFISPNTDPLFTHEACVTISSEVARLEEGQRLGVEAVPGASTRCPGETLCATLALSCIFT